MDVMCNCYTMFNHLTRLRNCLLSPPWRLFIERYMISSDPSTSRLHLCTSLFKNVVLQLQFLEKVWTFRRAAKAAQSKVAGSSPVWTKAQSVDWRGAPLSRAPNPQLLGVPTMWLRHLSINARACMYCRPLCVMWQQQGVKNEIPPLRD